MWIYNNFRIIYDTYKKKIDFKLDEFSYKLIQHVNNNNVSAMLDEIYDLSHSLKSIFIRCFKDIFFYHKDKYIKKYKLIDSNYFSEVWSDSISNLNFFLKKTIDSLEQEIIKEYYTSSSSDFVTWILPVKKGKGRFHGRFKTMLYMLSISFLNNVSKHLNEANGFESTIVDVKYNTEITSIKGIFHEQSDVHVLWKNGIGHNVPSYFGSKQVIIPYK